jgi:hypothetical protein
MKVHRVAAGFYTVTTALGVFEINRVDSAGLGMYEPTKMTEWFVTWPGRREPDAVTATLRDAKLVVERELETILNPSGV